MCYYNTAKAKGDIKMTLHLRVLDGEEQKIIADLIALCGTENVKLDYYKPFIDVQIETTYESGFCALFSEAHYLRGDYRILFFKTSNTQEQVSIPLKFIDCIYSL